MSLKVYIAYGTTSDQVTALRLQALGAVNGLSVYVPPAFTRQSTDGELDFSSKQQFDNCDVVLGVVAGGYLSAACRRELELGKKMDKRTIVLAEFVHGHGALLLRQFSQNMVLLDPSDPIKAEQEIVRLLRELGLQRDAAKALLALGTVALGLMLFASQD